MKDIKEITERLEAGVKEIFESGRFGEYLEFMGRFHEYSAGNCLLIMLQRPDASLVAGYRAWQTKFKRNVKKGEKGIQILAPRVHKVKKAVEDPDGSIEEKEITYTTFVSTTVFDISQTEGEELPTLAKKIQGSVEEFEELKSKLIALAPVPVDFIEIQGSANGYYNIAEKKIAVQTGMSEVQTIKTMIHEISHSMLHGDAGEEEKADRRTKEVQAESVAFTVCSALGLDTSDYSFGYVAGWSSGKDVRELSASMEVIRRTAQLILEGLRAA